MGQIETMCRMSQTSARKPPPAGPDVSLWFDQDPIGGSKEQVILNIVLRNGGLASAEVDSLVLWRLTSFNYEGLLSSFKYKGRLDLRVPGRVDVLQGPTRFPFRIGSIASVHMMVNVREVEVWRRDKSPTVESDYYKRLFFTRYGRLTAVLGNGAEVEYTRWWWSDFSALDERERRRLYRPRPTNPDEAP
jgi:hypothetical protein